MSNTLIQALLDDFEPARPRRRWLIVLAVGLLTAALSVVSIVALGLRPHWQWMWQAPPLFVRNLILLLLGVTAGVAAVSSGRPGSRSAKLVAPLLIFTGISGVLGILAALPLTGMSARLFPTHGLQCVTLTLLYAAAVSVLLTLWVRRDAPVNLGTTAWLIGLCGGALGAFAYSWHCPHDDPLYLGFWYALAVLLAALCARHLLKPLLRW